MDNDEPSSPPPSSAIPRHSSSFFSVPRRSTKKVSSPRACTPEESESEDNKEGPSGPSSIPNIPEWEEESEDRVPSWVPDLPNLSECGPEEGSEEVSDDEVVQQNTTRVSGQNVDDVAVDNTEEVRKDDGPPEEGNVTAGEGQMENGVDGYYKVEMWQKTYEYPIYPFPDTELEPVEGEHEVYHPPFLTRRAGRPRKHNRKMQEGEKKSGPRSNSVKCAICGVMGHNKRSCMGAQTKAKGKKPMKQYSKGAVKRA